MTSMTALGYLYKHVAPRPEWLKVESVVDIHSVSGCISEPFTDYVAFWKHNGFWFFDSPEGMRSLAAERGLAIDALQLFYYEALDRQFDVTSGSWIDFEPDPLIAVAVTVPPAATLSGYDVTSFSTGTMPECSPLSCNAMAERLAVNQHCLFRSLEDAKSALERGDFDNCEPGPYRVIAVYSVHAVW
jgi:hypothetical protein